MSPALLRITTWELGLKELEQKMLILWLLLMPGVKKFFISDLEVLYLWPRSIKLWQANLLSLQMV